jgi:RNA polymerase sigma factor (TIGR02999 family)
MARRRLQHERFRHELHAEELVHDAYLKTCHSAVVLEENHARFCKVASRVVQNALVDEARKRQAKKRGGAIRELSLDEVHLSTPGTLSEDVLALREVFDRLKKLDLRMSRSIQLRFVEGFTAEETAQMLEISVSTVKSDCKLAILWLRGHLEKSFGTRHSLTV